MPPINVPNALTVLRIVLVPVMTVALLQETRTGDYVAAGIFWFASVTDFVDGWLARRANLITDFGKLADPLADKLLVVGSLVPLAIVDRLALWIVVVILGRELLVTVIRQLVARRGEVKGAAWLGKVKTAFQMLVILLVILVVPIPGWLDAMVYAMVALTLVSGADFLLGVRRTLAATKAAPAH
ncbi:MAG: CDP-diacylglycerol--glycerol-3-phosphate 3-phosphatidyltransferase [Solirubrobacteraceae bacterium]|nr:CDP-diacylglycerol--glycerol-3-phosphate 3-phosphatidyltransferase [Solirubrobacteraceae bacterium]